MNPEVPTVTSGKELCPIYSMTVWNLCGFSTCSLSNIFYMSRVLYFLYDNRTSDCIIIVVGRGSYFCQDSSPINILEIPWQVRNYLGLHCPRHSKVKQMKYLFLHKLFVTFSCEVQIRGDFDLKHLVSILSHGDSWDVKTQPTRDTLCNICNILSLSKAITVTNV